MSIHKLHPRFVETVQSEGMYADGGSLYLQVSKGGAAKSWIFRYHVKGRGDRKMGLGSVHTIGLAEARDLARQCRQQRKDGIDPIEARKAAALAQELQAAKQVTFRTCAQEWMERNSDWVPNTRRSAESRLRIYIYPVLGHLPVSAINVNLVEKVIGPIWETKSVTAKRAQEHIEGVLSWATAKEYRTGDNPASLKGPLGIRLKPYTAVHTPTPNAALPHQKIGAFVAQLRGLSAPRSMKMGTIASP